MIPIVNNNWTKTEKTCSERPVRHRFVDIHCHCLPSIDDGPATRAEALALCKALVDDGITEVIATPHQLGRFNDCNQAPLIREQVSILNEDLKSNGIPLIVLPGADVRVDERICQLLEADKILTLADGGRYILLELPHQVFIDIEPLLFELASMGVQAVISHPERHPGLAKQPKVLLNWLRQSAYLQITAASLLGEFGPIAQETAWRFLSSGWASLVATDSHNLVARRPRMNAAYKSINTKLGGKIARLVCIENPSRILKGDDIASIHSTK